MTAGHVAEFFGAISWVSVAEVAFGIVLAAVVLAIASLFLVRIASMP
jgi:hypothetical protein